MKTKTCLCLALAVVLPLSALNSRAWDSFGHMTVAYLAYQQLTPTVKQRANQLIKLNPQYSEWVGWLPANTSADDQDMMTFMVAATWPDEIRSNPNYTSDGSAHGDRPEGSPNPTANIGYSDMLMHKYWHFVDKPFSTDGTHLPEIPTPNAQDRITLFRGVLASTSDDQLKSYDLVWLLHLVGDVHQPLHCTTRASTSDTNGDSGGNDVKLINPTNELHAVWDDLLGDASPKKGIKKVIKVANNLAAPDATMAADTNEADWVTESFQAAQASVYIPPIGSGNGPYTLTTGYKTQAKKVAEERIALAGARLANLLNANLK